MGKFLKRRSQAMIDETDDAYIESLYDDFCFGDEKALPLLLRKINYLGPRWGEVVCSAAADALEGKKQLNGRTARTQFRAKELYHNVSQFSFLRKRGVLKKKRGAHNKPSVEAELAEYKVMGDDGKELSLDRKWKLYSSGEKLMNGT